MQSDGGKNRLSAHDNARKENFVLFCQDLYT